MVWFSAHERPTSPKGPRGIHDVPERPTNLLISALRFAEAKQRDGWGLPITNQDLGLVIHVENEFSAAPGFRGKLDLDQRNASSFYPWRHRGTHVSGIGGPVSFFFRRDMLARLSSSNICSRVPSIPSHRGWKDNLPDKDGHRSDRYSLPPMI
jgi:hypothetical protein